MLDTPPGPTEIASPRSAVFGRLRLSTNSRETRLRILRWAVPVLLFVLVVVYQFGPARWVHDALGETMHFFAEVVVYGTVGPVLAYLLLDFVSRWMAERETSELQAKMLAEAHSHAKERFVQNDDALQNLFAVSIILASLQQRSEELPPDLAAQVAEAKRAMAEAIQRVNDVRSR